jgi:hypothetical protein
MTIKDDNRPNLTLVSSQDRTLLAIHEARADFSYHLRQLAANLLRITAGAGKPHELMSEMSEVLHAAEEVRLAGGTLDIIETALDIEHLLRERNGNRFVTSEARKNSVEDGSDRQSLGLAQVKQGALRQVAAELLGQRTQQSVAENQVYQGINEIQQARIDRDRYYRSNPRSELLPALFSALLSKSQVAALRIVAGSQENMQKANTNSLRSLSTRGYIELRENKWRLTTAGRTALSYHDQKDGFETSRRQT